MIMRSTNNSILIKHAYYKRRARAIIANVSLIAIVLCICIMMLCGYKSIKRRKYSRC